MTVTLPAVKLLRTGRMDQIAFDLPKGYQAAVWGLIQKAEKTGDYLQLRMGLPRKPRTTGWRSQNHHINGHCQQIAMETGNSFSAVKERMKVLAIGRGYPIETLVDGTVLPASETDVDTVEAGYLIDAIDQFAAEWGITLKETEE